MHLDLSYEGAATGMRQVELLKGYYVPDVPRRVDISKLLSRWDGRKTVLTDDLICVAYTSNNNKLSLERLARQASKKVSLDSKWRQHVLNPAAPSDVDSLTETVETVMDYVADFGPAALDLSGLSPAQVHCEHLASVLRATSLWHREVPGWNDALIVAREACVLADQDVHDVLFGMV